MRSGPAGTGVFVPVHAPFGPAVADLVLATAVHAGDAMPPRAFVDQPLPGRDRNDTFKTSRRGGGNTRFKKEKRRSQSFGPQIVNERQLADVDELHLGADRKWRHGMLESAVRNHVNTICTTSDAILRVSEHFQDRKNCLLTGRTLEQDQAPMGQGSPADGGVGNGGRWAERLWSFAPLQLKCAAVKCFNLPTVSTG